ncbi:MAG: branched-chain amino acid aminotransferase [Hyphomicrobium sp.]|nr:MAG: branched-chain amino acid aminotransferase [Hyphomicrobium sp.]
MTTDLSYFGDPLIWFDGRIMPSEQATIHVLTHGLHYGSCVFEGERAYDGSVYKSRVHTERLMNSAGILDFTLPYSVDQIEAAKAEILSRNGGGNKYVRAVAWRGGEKMMAVAAQQNPIHVAIATWNWPSMFDPAERMRGIKLDIAEYRRPDPMCAPAFAKAAGLYMICTLSKHKAERKGYADALMYDWQGRVAECTGANVFFVSDGKIHTPIADCFLSGITRATVIELARQRGFEVIERRIMPDELGSFSECFITGSAAEVTPVREIGGFHYQPGRISEALLNDYMAEVRPQRAAAE